MRKYFCREDAEDVYVCDICGKEDMDKSYIEECEATHKKQKACQHFKTSLEMDFHPDGRHLYEECQNCHKVIKERTLTRDQIKSFIRRCLDEKF